MKLLLKYIFIFIFTFLIVFGCKKDNGKTFLRVIPITDTSIISLNVADANGNFIVDGNYHEVNSRLELSYVLKNMVKYEVKDWTTQMIYNKYTYYDFYINEYFGEFENKTTDSYYTFSISYYSIKSEPIYNSYAHYYFYSYDYYDNSKLVLSSKP